ncbi:MAG: hypothetical protein HKL99_14475 [Burkholderiales bacterium]|nr:hypothetical protein [Burkholderiales bacterium]
MKKLILSSTLAAALCALAPASFAATTVSAGVDRMNIGGGRAMNELNVGVINQSGGMLYSATAALSSPFGGINGVQSRSFAASVGTVAASAGSVELAPTMEIGYDKLGDGAVKHVAAGVGAMYGAGDVTVFGGLKLGRAFGANNGFDSGAYTAEDIGVGYRVGPGLVTVALSNTQLPTVGGHINENRAAVGFTEAF